jgi:Ca2+-binding EF-hand superfamily protein
MRLFKFYQPFAKMMTRLPILAALILGATSPLATAAKASKLDKRFERADVDNDERLSPTEFLATQDRKISEVAAQFRFNAADVNDNGFIELVEFRASRAGVSGGKPSRAETFILADLDDDGFLDPVEYSRTLSQLTPFPKALNAFDKRDKDDDGELSAREFGLRRPPL